MSWLKNTSQLLARQLTNTLDPKHSYEPQACYSSFCKHWQQANDIIQKSQPQHLHDDVLGVVNHLEQLTTLLELEARAREINRMTSPASCLEYLLSENLLDKLYEWSICTGKYENAVKLEQLKIFSKLISHYSSQVIAAEPFLRPLLKLLSGFRNLNPPNLENQLVTLLNQLCVVLMQNMKFIDLFFLMVQTANGSQAEFIIGRLLLACVHRSGAAGAAARDALLLCAKMSARCAPLARCLITGDACHILAPGLSGLYSVLPRTLPDDVHRLAPDDVNRVHKLTLFVDSLEFCNAVAEVAHPSIKKHLIDLLCQGFLVPVLGPALLQSGVAEQAAATAYLELFIRCCGQRGLLRTFLHFIFTYQYDGVKIFDVLLGRLEGNSQLSLVTLSLMETLIDLNCEDVMIELIYKYLLNGNYLMSTYRNKIGDPDLYRDAAVAFLSLRPRVCKRPLEKTQQWVEELALSGRRVLDLKRESDRRVNGVHEDIALNSLVQEVKIDYGNPNESLYGNYHAYLCDARFQIVSRTIACMNWTSKYDAILPKRETNNNKETKEIDIHAHTSAKEPDSLISICTSGYDTIKTSEASEKEAHSLNSLNEAEKNGMEDKEHDSLTSISDEFDSFRFRDDDDEGFCEDSFMKSIAKTPEDKSYEEVHYLSCRVSADTIIGPLLCSLLKKTANCLQSELIVNCRVTSIISKLVAFPTPIIAALLCPGFVLQPNVPSLFQILKKLKEELDELTNGLTNAGELIDKARVFLVQREMALVSRSHNDGAAQKPSSPARPSEESPFRRTESKRRSFSSSFSNMFGKKSPSPSPHSPQNAQNSTYLSPAQKRPIFTQEAYWNQSITLRSILNAVILEEWLKELSALCEEHALRLSAENYEDDNFVHTVAL
ncbi:FHIP family protein CG3558 isoform X2 [Aricia agestis]|uniref:FHIP family protein CG3558 isoform X2 n=1 Tax=Aricia agestis TaxID=91739 RepID=UPI001C202E17|nr:FHIP family protein CG3558 isoform X2 [Aricia agestis]